MRIFLTSDTNADSGISEVGSKLYAPGIDTYFKDRDYGSSLIAGISVVLMCRDPRWNFTRRIRMDWKTATLRMDIMLDYDKMKPATPQERQREVAQRLYDEVPEVLERYRKKLKDFDMDRFISDLRDWIDSLGWR